MRKDKRKQVNENNHSSYYQFGYDTFGPFLFGFSRWLYSNVSCKDYNKVFFFSRDGYMMEKAFSVLNEDGIKNEYVFFSRNSIRQALLWRTKDYNDSLRYLTWERFYSYGKILEYYGFKEGEREQLSREYGFELSKDISNKQLSDNLLLKKLFNDNKQIIHKRSKEQDSLLLQYTQQIGMTGDCAIVDIGWHGSMQYYLEQFFEQHGINTTLDGYYVGILPNVPLKGSCDGYIYNREKPKLRKHLLCFFGGYEKLFQSQEGSTIGYIETYNKIIKPRLGEYEYSNNEDADVIESIKEWQQGALDYIVQINNREQYSDKALTKPLINFGRKPHLKDVQLMSFFYNNEGSRAYYTTQKKLREYSPHELMHDLSNSPWKTGFMKSAFKVPFPYYAIYEAIRK